MADNALALSDEDFMNQDPDSFLVEAAEEAGTDEGGEGDKADDVSDQTDADKTPEAEAQAEADGDSGAQEQSDADADADKVSDPDGDTRTEHETSTDGDATDSLDTSDEDDTDTKGDNPDTDTFNYESAFKEVSQPFKANGVEMQVRDPKDIIRLMQMGANYQKKMAEIKPNLKVVKMLENNGLLDEAKLHNLIDLSKKDPKAVAAFIKESGIDPLDIDADEPTDYKPTNYSVSDKEFALDQVLDDIKGTDTFEKTINVLTKEWDAGSKNIVSDNPEIISIINTHMANGVYDKVNAQMQQEKTLGKLDGLSDVAAYRQVAEQMAESGILQEQGKSKAKDPAPSTVSSETDDEATSQADAERNKGRKAAAPGRQTTTSKSDDTAQNFLGLSDEEFAKKYAAG